MKTLEKLAIGIDIGGTRTKIGLVDLAMGKVLETVIYLTETKNSSSFEQKLGETIQYFQSKYPTASHFWVLVLAFRVSFLRMEQ